MAGETSQLSEHVPEPVQASPERPPADGLAAELRRFGPLGILAILVILLTGNIWFRNVVVPVGALLTLLWTRLSRTPWREIGYIRPQSWIGPVGVGIVFGVAFKFLMKAIVMPLLGADSVNQTYQYLVGNRAGVMATVPLMMVTAGFGEETFFRGYLFERFGKLIGHSPGAKALTVLFTSVFFASLHYFDQGLAGAQQATVTGLVFGTIFAFTGRIWTLMCAHAAFDLTAVAIIYWGLESGVAHLVFK